MDWKEMIKEGMKLIKEGCKKNEWWPACNDCPFTLWCDDILEANDGKTPDELF